MSRDACEAWDRRDPLRPLREDFHLEAGRQYLVGHSLGLAPRAARDAVAAVTAGWAEDAVAGWNRRGWLDAPVRVGACIAPLIGAGTDEVVVTDATTVNLFRLLCAALDARPDRRVVLYERDNFPADNYIVEGVVTTLGFDVEARAVEIEALAGAIDDSVGVVVASHVNYRTGAVAPAAEISDAARRCGAWTLWDLAHSAGAVDVNLSGMGADLAVGCGYKYLCGGPGAPAFTFVRRGLQARLRSPMWGWLGHASPFAFEPDYRPAEGMRRFVCGTPPILSMAALEGALRLFEGLQPTTLELRVRRLTTLFRDRLEQGLRGDGLQLAGVGRDARRGGHVLLRHPEAPAVRQWLRDRGLECDVRAPDGLRFGFSPLYSRLVDAWDAAETLLELDATRAWEGVSAHREGPVT